MESSKYSENEAAGLTKGQSCRELESLKDLRNRIKAIETDMERETEDQLNRMNFMAETIRRSRLNIGEGAECIIQQLAEYNDYARSVGDEHFKLLEKRISSLEEEVTRNRQSE